MIVMYLSRQAVTKLFGKLNICLHDTASVHHTDDSTESFSLIYNQEIFQKNIFVSKNKMQVLGCVSGTAGNVVVAEMTDGGTSLTQSATYLPYPTYPIHKNLPTSPTKTYLPHPSKPTLPLSFIFSNPH